MTVWDDYEIFDPQVERPLAELTRGEARAHYARVMDSKDHRIQELKKLASAAGVDLDGTENALQAFNDWFVKNIEPNPENPDQARGRWFSVAHDLSLYLADLMIAKYPHLHWRLHERGKRNLSYQRPVLVGFRNAHPTYSVDLDYALTEYANGLARGDHEEPDLFVQLLRWPDKVA
jgi:hypothetical protein